MKNDKRGMPAAAILTLLILILVPLLIGSLLTPSGGGSGDYDVYGGPVLPMTALSGAETLTVRRNVDFDFAPYGDAERRSLDMGSAIITDSYVLTNPTAETVVAELAYGFEGQFIDPPAEFPQITVDGVAVEGRLYASVDVGGAIHRARNWETYREILTERDHLGIAMEPAPQPRQEMTACRLSDLTYDTPKPEGAVYFGVQFAIPQGTQVWVDIFAMTRCDEETGEIQVYFHENQADAWLYFLGDAPEKLTPVANVGYNVTKDSTVEGVQLRMEQSTVDFAQVLREYAAAYDYWELNEGYPNAGFLTQELLYDGALKRLADPDYRVPSGDIYTMESVLHEVVTEIRMLYRVFSVEIPARSSVTVNAAYTQEPSRDISGPKEHREGYDMATRLGSNLNFTQLSASLSNSDWIRIVNQNFGFDLQRGITAVEPELNTERYYLDIAPQ